MVIIFKSMCSKDDEVLSDVDGTINRTEVVASGVIGSGEGGSIADKCVRAETTVYCAGIITGVDGMAQWSDSLSLTR